MLLKRSSVIHPNIINLFMHQISEIIILVYSCSSNRNHIHKKKHVGKTRDFQKITPDNPKNKSLTETYWGKKNPVIWKHVFEPKCIKMRPAFFYPSPSPAATHHHQHHQHHSMGHILQQKLVRLLSAFFVFFTFLTSQWKADKIRETTGAELFGC